MWKKYAGVAVVVLVLSVAAASVVVRTDEFTEEDLKRWDKEYQSVVTYGRELWGSGDLGTNGVACGQCHPNGANTHPETYPKFQQQLGKVVALRDMINWCLRNPLEGDPLDLDSAEMIAIEAYLMTERKGVAIAPGKH